VLAACKKELGTTDSDWAPTDLVLKRSTDNGTTWSEEQTILHRDGYVIFNGNFVEDRETKTVFACFIMFPHAERRTWFSEKWIEQGGGFWISRSTDDGVSWSDPEFVLPKPNADGWHGGGAYNNVHGIQIQRGKYKGRLVINARVIKPGKYEKRGKGGLIYSDDHGKTWHVGAPVLVKDGSYNGEVTLAETSTGEVYVNSRNQTSKSNALMRSYEKRGKLNRGIIPYRRIYSRSRDGGQSFYREGIHEELFDPPCNAGITEFYTNEGKHLLLFTKPGADEPKNRLDLTGYVSHDDGRSWIKGNRVSRTGGYSDIAVLPDERIVVLYENRTDDTLPHGLLLARFNLEWLTGE
jgi:sialidase-1